MKIAVFGYYNALNAGDDRIQNVKDFHNSHVLAIISEDFIILNQCA